MKKKKVVKRIVATTLAFTLCMQSVGVYAMDENDFQSITFDEEIDTENDTENEEESYSADQEDVEEELTITDDYEEEDPAVEFSSDDSSENDDTDEVFVDAEEGESEETGASVSDFSYEELNGSYVSITGYTGAEKNVVIPDSIDGFIVQKIGNGAFKNKDIESIKFPDRMDILEMKRSKDVPY